MLMNNVGLYRSPLQPKATTFTSNSKNEEKQDIINDNTQEPKQSSKGSKSILALMGIAAAGGTLYLLSKGKKGKAGEKAAGEAAGKVGDEAENIGKKVKDFVTKKKDKNSSRKVKRNKARVKKMIEQAIADTPTSAQQAAYNKSIAYVAPTVEEKAIIKANNTLAAQKNAEARQIQNNLPDETVAALEQLKETLPKRRVTKKAEAPKPLPPRNPVKKQTQIDEAWAQYTRPAQEPKVKPVPSASDIWAAQEAEAAKMAKDEAEALKSLGF